jgi:outer membrane protein assembly factor BamD
LLAEKSVVDKQSERYTNALDEYFSFIDEYPESDHRKEVDKFYEKASEILNYKEEDLNIN